MANADTVTDVLEHAGYEDIRLARQDLPYKVGNDLDQAVAINLEIGPGAEVLEYVGRPGRRHQAQDRRRHTRGARGFCDRRRRRRRAIINVGRDRTNASVAGLPDWARRAAWLAECHPFFHWRARGHYALGTPLLRSRSPLFEPDRVCRALIEPTVLLLDPSDSVALSEA